MPQTFRYRAFLSYSHKDKTWADWIHKALESFALGDDLAGRETEAGIVPKTLSPIFRDRDDFSAGPSLASQSLAALESSHSLVVLCSPRAAQSPYVNEEIRAFKALGRETRVFALIIEGEPGDPARECFPPALRFIVGPDGALTDTRVEPIAADARAEGDGKRVALVKIVAGITGLPFNDIRKREVLAHKRAQRIRFIVAASIAALSVGLGTFWWKSQLQAVQIVLTQDLLKSLIGSAQAQGIMLTPEQQTQLGKTLGDTATQAATGDKRAGEALALLNTGKVGEATAIFRVIANEKAKQADAKATAADKDRREAAEAFKRVGAIASTTDPKAAREAYAKAVALNPADIDAQFALMRLSRNFADWAEGEKAALALKQLAENAGDIYAKAGAIDMLGDVESERDKFGSALKFYEDSLAIAEKLAAEHPDDLGWQRGVTVSISKIGNVRLAQGDFVGALERYEMSLSIRERLVAADPKNAQWLRDLSVGHSKIGDVYSQKYDYANALKSFSASLAILENLTARDPHNAGWQRDLSTAYNKIGDMRYSSQDFDAALKNYESALAIAEKLVRMDATNAVWSGDLEMCRLNITTVKAALATK